MRIVVNDIAASEGGALSVLRDFYETIKLHDKENEYIFLVSDQYIADTERIKTILLPEVKKSHFKKVIFDFWRGKRLINRLQPDVVFCLQNIITFGVHAPQVVYVHQSIPYQKEKKFSFLKRSERGLAFIQYVIGWAINRSIEKADKVIVQTQWMRQAIVEKTRISDDKVYVAAPSVDVKQEQSWTKAFNRKSFFYPTSAIPYKNNELVIEASKHLLSEGINEFNIELTLPKEDDGLANIHRVGRLSREEVFERYKKGTLLFPSYIETYGMPLVEARSFGTVILASDCTYAREVLDGYDNAYFFDYNNATELAALMKRVIQGQIFPTRCMEKNNKNNNSWVDVIEIFRGIKEKDKQEK